MWGLASKDRPDVLIGLCGFKESGRQQPTEMDAVISPEYREQGLMQEALNALLEHGFDELGFHRIEALVEPNNGPAARLLDKLGFQQEATLREFRIINGRFEDCSVFGLLAEDHARMRVWWRRWLRRAG